MPLHRLSVSLILCLLLCLAGCSGGATETAHFIPPTTSGGQLCVAECGQSRNYCRQSCDLERRGCSNAMQKQAIEDYEIYVRDQYRTHQPLELRPRDFERPQKCAPDVCYKACDRGHQSCYENCGGSVSFETSCQFLCF